MIYPKTPENESLRQAAVEKYQLLDTLPEESYDNITELMAYICDAPISLITLLDNSRNFLKSHKGIKFSESPRNISFCGHAINSHDEIMIVEDAREDERFHDNPIVTENNAIFYAGVPLVDPNGYKLGTLCVYDSKPRKLEPQQEKALISMAKQVVQLLEQNYKNIQLLKFQEKLEKRNENLNKFARVVSHDLKSPLANIIGLTDLLETESKDKLNKNSITYLTHLKTSSKNLRNYIDGILDFYRSEDLVDKSLEIVDLELLIQELKGIIGPQKDVEFRYSFPDSHITINKAALLQILINLVTNALKYNDKATRTVEISFEEDGDFYVFTVEDNGNGIHEEYLDKIFSLFSVAVAADRNGKAGTGIGLATVKNLVTELGGEIKVDSKIEKGSVFSFSICKRIGIK
jgi:signal transduction histidine kinase